MKARSSLTYLFIFTLLTYQCMIEVKGDGNDSEEDVNETSSEETYQFETEDDIEEVNVEDDQPENEKGGSSSAVEEKGEYSPPAEPIQINIQPVSSDEFSCKGVPNGNQVDPHPTNCLSFYTCVDETTYKIMCPQIPYKTYYDPVQKTCGDVSETLCLEFATSQPDSEKKSDLTMTPEEEQDRIVQKNFGGEIFDERMEL